MIKTVIVTFLYPESSVFFGDFINSLKQQTDNQFDLIIFLDQINEKQLEKNFSGLNITSKPLSGSIAEIREKGFEYLKSTEYENFILLDADDTMAKNRVETSKRKLKNHDIVCCDLNIIDESKKVIDENIWSKRLGENFVFDESFIKNKNILGLGNVCFNKNILNLKWYFSNQVIALDWYIFYLILRKNKLECLFTNETQVNYRQHSNNIAGFKDKSVEEIDKIIKVKKHHYNQLIQDGYTSFDTELLNLEELDYQNQNYNNYPFWWETK